MTSTRTTAIFEPFPPDHPDRQNTQSNSRGSIRIALSTWADLDLTLITLLCDIPRFDACTLNVLRIEDCAVHYPDRFARSSFRCLGLAAQIQRLAGQGARQLADQARSVTPEAHTSPLASADSPITGLQPGCQCEPPGFEGCTSSAAPEQSLQAAAAGRQRNQSQV